MNIEKYGYQISGTTENGSGIPGRITAVYRERFEIVCEYGTGYARLQRGKYHSGKNNIPTTGDFVLLDWQESGDSRIIETLPRKTYFSRLDPSSSGHGEQAVAANFDYVFIIQSLDGNFNPKRLERYLTLAWQSGATPAVILTKADNVEDTTTHILAAEKAAIGVNIYALSAKTREGLEQLDEYLKPGKTIVFLGSSGVGKSTLVNTLLGEERMVTGSIRESDSRGRHTTSHRQLILLKSGVMIIDTPGMRELGMWDVSEGIGQSFCDVEQYFGQCKFNDCRHQGEPGCAVKAAIQNGELPSWRYESYLKLHAEAQYIDDKAGYLREKQKRFKEIAKIQRAKKQIDYRHTPCQETFTCQVCKELIQPEEAGSSHRNHCPHCLTSIHADNKPGDRASLCRGIMDPIAIWVKKNGEWAIIHRCRSCGTLNSNRIAADDDTTVLMSMAMKPLACPLNKQPNKAAVPIPAHRITSDQEKFTCIVCGEIISGTERGQQRDHCPRCLTSIHTDQQAGDGASLCKGTMEVIAIWIDENGEWNLVHRCRSCQTLRVSRIAADDNITLLMSIALKPLAAPPFPLWQVEKAADISYLI